MANWYGIKSVRFIWHGEWSDPEIAYKGMVVNCYVVEDTMWEKYKNYCEENNQNVDENDGFEQYMLENADEVKELIELAYEAA